MFGSVVRDEDRPDSDVDLLAHLPRPDLEAILGTRIELIHAVDLKPGARERAERGQVQL